MPEKKLEQLLKKYLEGRATPEEEKLIDEWYDSLSAGKEFDVTERQRDSFRNSYWHGLRSKIRAQTARRLITWPALKVAASIVALVVIAFYITRPRAEEQIAKVVAPLEVQVIDNTSAEVRRFMLPDSSQLTLFPGSSLRYDENFNVAIRKVQLSGKAFFEVSHNREKPFYVFANELVTRVLGTSFSITAWPNGQNVTVAVATGKVSVYKQSEASDLEVKDAEQIVLTPNQQAVYSKGDQKVSRTLVTKPRRVISEEDVGKVRFEGAPVSEVFEALGRMYDIEIDYDEAVFSKCAITTSISGKDMFERIDVICEVIGAEYTVEDTTIIIKGTGCN